MRVSPQITIDNATLKFSFARAAGPGGQNVNKVNSKAILTWSLEDALDIPADVKVRIRQKWGSRINKAGQLILTSQRHRDQSQNIADCLDKLREIVSAAEHPPKPRVATRRTKASKLRRLDAKRHTSTRKKLRRSPRDAGD